MKLISVILIANLLFSSCTKGSENCSANCTSVQCSANTQAGVRCQNITKNCCGRCYLHI